LRLHAAAGGRSALLTTHEDQRAAASRRTGFPEMACPARNRDTVDCVEDDARRPPAAGPRQDPWRVRIHDGDGAVLGAGILLSDGRVLTCAHVLPEKVADLDPSDGGHGDRAGWPIRVDLVGRFPVRSRRARVAPRGWVPARADVGLGSVGDVVLLEVDPLPCLPGRSVRICGFPAGGDQGIWLAATVSGPSGEWVQLNAVTEPGPQVRPGFSGAGVLDEATGTVIGMVVAKGAERDRGVFWMLPIDAVASHLPSMADLVTGDPLADASFRAHQKAALDETVAAALHTLVEALGARSTGRPIMFLSEQEDVRSAAFGLLVTRADRAIRARMPQWFARNSPPGTLPRVGSIDVAVDASGRTTAQVCRRLADRLGLIAGSAAELVGQLRAGSPKSITLVVDCVDRAAEPVELFTDLLYPLAQSGSKVVLGARSMPAVATGRTTVVDLDVRLGAGTGPGPIGKLPVPDRLDRLDNLVDRVGAAEAAARAAHHNTALRILDAPPVREEFASLQLRVLRLRMGVRRLAPTDRKVSDILAALDAAEGRVADALHRARDAQRRLDALLAERDDQRGLLDAYRVLAACSGLGEDLPLTELFTEAHRRLWKAPCDLPAARAAVTDYLHALWHRLGLSLGGNTS
jgi:hypothetical protein